MDKRPIAAGKSSFGLVDWNVLFAELYLHESMVLIDVASGAGNYSLAIAEALEGCGEVYAFDLWREGIEDLKRRAAERGLKNIKAEITDVSKCLPLPNDTADVCLIVTALHDLVEDGSGEGTLKEVSRVLKTGGRLVMAEFKKTDGPPGPPKKIRLSPEELDELILPFGFTKEHIVDSGEYTYVSAYVLRK